MSERITVSRKNCLPTCLNSVALESEIIREGSDVTIVSYGSTLRIIAEAAEYLSGMDIDCEIMDVQPCSHLIFIIVF
jgi:pyruvate/2-oxoglutarate/acetoin dehydrogenase E1 component